MAKIEERDNRGGAFDCNLTLAIPQHSSLYCKGVNLHVRFRLFKVRFKIWRWKQRITAKSG